MPSAPTAPPRTARRRRALYTALLLLTATPRPTAANENTPADHIVQRAATALLLGDSRELQAVLSESERQETAPPAAGESASPNLSNSIAWLVAIDHAGPEGIDPLEAKALLAEEPYATTRYQIEDSKRRNLLIHLNRLRFWDRYNRLVTPLNAILMAAAGALEGQASPALRAAVDLSFGLPDSFQVSGFDRQRHAMAVQWLNTPNLPAATRQRLLAEKQRIEPRIDKASAADHLRRGLRAQAQGQTTAALQAANAALQDDPAHSRARKLRQTLSRQLAIERRQRDESNLTLQAGPENETPALQNAYHQLVAALAEGDPHQLRRTLETSEAALRGSPYEPYLPLTHSTLFDLEQHRGLALSYLQIAANRHGSTAPGRRARAQLQDPAYNPLERLDRERAAVRRDTSRYLLFGPRSIREHAWAASRTAVTSIGSALENIGLLTLVEVTARGFRLTFSSPIRQDGVLEAAEQILACPGLRLTDSKRRKLLIEMARRAERTGNIAAARQYHEQAGRLPAKTRQRLDEKEADQLFAQAAQTGDSAEALALCEKVAERFPKTNAGRRAADRLEEWRRRANLLLEIPREWLLQNPRHWGRLGLPLRRSWLEAGDHADLADPAIVVRRQAPETAEVQLTGNRFAKLPLKPDALARLQAATHSRRAAERAIDRCREDLHAQSTPPYAIQGSIGAGGFDLSPHFGHHNDPQQDNP